MNPRPIFIIEQKKKAVVNQTDWSMLQLPFLHKSEKTILKWECAKLSVSK